jgi:hypothetical protein
VTGERMMRAMAVSPGWVVCAAVLLALCACQSTASRSGFYSSPLQPGDSIELLSELTVPPLSASVYLQNGRPTSYGGTNQYAPFCYFRLRDPLPVEQTLSPEVMEVESVWLDTATVSVERPLRLAAALATSAGGDRSPIAYQFRMKLKSQAHSGIRLVCSGAFDVPAIARPIRLPEMRAALGDYVAVRVREPAQVP